MEPAIAPVSPQPIKEPIFEPLLRWFRIRRVIAQVPLGATVLDVGCGRSAKFLRAIAPRIRQGVGVDFKVTHPPQLPNLETHQLHLDELLPFEDNRFQVVTMLAVLEHIEHEAEILAEIYRVLQPGGKLVLTVPSIWSQPVLEFLSYRLKLISEEEIRDHKRYYTRDRLHRVLVDKTGFTCFHHRYFQLWMNNFCVVRKGE